jgi:cytochrome c oxidase subunit II
MTFLIILMCLILFVVVVVQIGKVTELSGQLRGAEEAQIDTNKINGALGLGFLGLFMVLTLWSMYHYSGMFLGYGVNVPASEHGASIDFMFNVTLIVTLPVFVLCHVLLFWYAWKFRGRPGHKAVFWHHNTQLEIVWMGIPALAMAFLVIQGITTWNNAMSDIPEGAVPGKDFIEIEMTGQQFGWVIRYPGADNVLGEKYFTYINKTDNPLGQKWEDKRNHDDFLLESGVFKLPVNKKIRIRITSKDVLHSVYLPQFRVKMDAVPGMPTYFVFTPTITSDSMKQILRTDPAYQVPSHADATKTRWEAFTYELACAELCGKGHYSMRRELQIVSQEEYDKWLKEQKSHYETNIKGTASDVKTH